MISKETRKKAREKAEALVGQMTLEEKAAQLKYGAPALKRLGIPAYNWWNEALYGVARDGTATMFPQPVAMASMFDPEMIRKVSSAMTDCFDDTTVAEAGRYYVKGAVR